MFFTEASDGKEDDDADADDVAPNVAAAAAEPTVSPIKREAVKRMQVPLCARVCVCALEGDTYSCIMCEVRICSSKVDVCSFDK